MTALFVERQLELESDAGEETGRICIFAPKPDDRETHTPWLCAYSISWLGFDWKHEMTGADALQALTLALKIIPTIIETSDDFKSGRLRLPSKPLVFEGRTYAAPNLHEIFGLQPFSTGSTQ